jgi:internalin A
VRDPEAAWVTGVLFERDASSLLAEVLPRGGEIELRARGPERKALLSVIAADLDALNDSFQGMRGKVDKRVPCICTRCRAAAEPEFFGERALLKRKQDHRLKVECPASYEDVDVLSLLDGVRTSELPVWAKDDTPPAGRTIRVFLASSAELRADRDAFDLYFRQQNDELRKRGSYLEIVRWESFLDAMSETRLQDEYNQAIRACDVFVCLFHTKVGKFTDEEFEVAHRRFVEIHKPRIYTFFKDEPVKPSSIADADWSSLRVFQKKLQDLGHYWTKYDGIEHLKRQFRDQLDKLLADA